MKLPGRPDSPSTAVRGHALERDSATSSYVQMAQRLRHRCRLIREQRQPAAESELTRHFGANRVTMRQIPSPLLSWDQVKRNPICILLENLLAAAVTDTGIRVCARLADALPGCSPRLGSCATGFVKERESSGDDGHLPKRTSSIFVPKTTNSLPTCNARCRSVSRPETSTAARPTRSKTTKPSVR